MRRGAPLAVALLLSALGAPACAKAWEADESHRIDEAMSCPPFDPDSGAARGLALYRAPPLAPPWREGEGYQLNQVKRGPGRKLRVGREKADRPRRKGRKSKASRSTRVRE